MIGICPGTAALRTGHWFQGQLGRRIWRKLERAGLLVDAVRGAEDEAWVHAGHGLTDVVKRAHETLAELEPAEIARGVEALRGKVRAWKPRVVLFGFKRAARLALGSRQLAAGPCEPFEGVPTFLLSGPFIKPADATREADVLAKL